HRSWLTRPVYWQVRAELARAAGDAATTAEATRQLVRLAARAWPATAWDFRGGGGPPRVLAPGPAPRPRPPPARAPHGGARGAVGVGVDEGTLGAFPGGGGGALALAAPLAAGLHLLEVETVGGGAVLPGAVELAEGGRGDDGGAAP